MKLCFPPPRAICGLILTALAAGCGRDPSAVKTVEIPQTPIKSQGQVGFCWAYTTAALVESQALVDSGATYDLSEEAIGFYRIAEELSYLGRTYSSEELSSAQKVVDLGVEGITGSDFLFHAQQKAFGRYPAALQLVEKYGVVPESTWSIKFGKTNDGNPEGSLAIDAIIERFVTFKATHPESDCCDVPTLAREVMLAPEGEVGFKSEPPHSFTVDGATLTAVEYFHRYFDVPASTQYQVVTANQSADYAPLVQSVKRALDRGEPVALEFSVDAKYIDFDTATFSGEFHPDIAADMGLDPNDTAFNLNGGHVVLITDYVNIGGRPGLVSPKEKAAALAAAPDQLDYFVVKNSWGESDAPAGVGKGYYLLKKKYIELNINTHAPGQVSTFFVAVPRRKR